MKQKNTNDYFEVLRKIQKKPDASQRQIAEELGFSLGKLNYCIKALHKKGLIKLQNFNRQKNKIGYLRYVITPKGISERTKLTIDFMKRKMREYDELKRELEEKIIMWIVAKVDKKNLFNLKKEFSFKLGEGLQIYSPKILLEKFTKKKLIKKEIEILVIISFAFIINLRAQTQLYP